MTASEPDIPGEPHGATPLDEEDLVDLIPDHVTTRAELDLAEFDNIAGAVPWAIERAHRGGVELVLDFSFLTELHHRMFGEVWTWAGRFRRRATNLGVDPSQIATQTRQSLDDSMWWHRNDTFELDERAARIHHRLVAVHPFTNGNGRCTRLVADLYLLAVGRPMLTWGAQAEGNRVVVSGETRRSYIQALRAADDGDLAALTEFARS